MPAKTLVHRLSVLVFLLLLTTGLVGVGPGLAEEGDDPKPPGAEDEDGGEVGPGPDLGDQKVPFAEQVNRAIDLGSKWLRAKPMVGPIPGTEDVRGAHWGFIKGTRFYGNREGREYRHPAGPTALALYTLLKCGALPKDPAIKAGFAWLKSLHRITDEWDKWDAGGKERYWFHTVAVCSYELSVMILALTAKYDPYKKTARTMVARRRGKLRIKNKEDRIWLQQMVEQLIHRRGQPGKTAIKIDRSLMKRYHDPNKEADLPYPDVEDLPPREERLGWRYNRPKLNLVRATGGGRGKGKSYDNLQTGSQPGHIANQDLSSTQLAALALFAAHQFGVKIPEQVWADIVEFTLSHQEEEGPEHQRHDPILTSGGYSAPVDHARGFMYIKGSPEHNEGVATGSMTACGIANLLMAKQILSESSKGRKIWSEKAWDRTVDTAIWDGLAWLDRHWSPFTNPVKHGYHTYYLYSIERAQDLRLKELIGKHLWYREGAMELLKRQKSAKVTDPFDTRAPEMDVVFWNTGSTHDPKDVLDTCFTLLFLKRATRNLAPAPITPGDGGPADNR